ncbi:MAG TPA: hypothetical protein VEZ90_18045, partial [Blastocatellia bacterium]|nr:hypothetical protein [Blastocatellia bacterium]
MSVRVSRRYDQHYSHEEIIIQRYDWLFNWSMKLTGYNRPESEDLVHDAFVEFTLSAPDIGSIENIDGYLYGLLRNLSLSRARRRSRIDWQSDSVLDYDSAELWLRSAHPDSLIHARQLLSRVCDFACLRKEASKSGSFLILRFFHGYYPSEIAAIARCTRTSIDGWLLISRREAKAALENVISSPRPGPVYVSTQDFLDGLRRTIFRSRKGKCLDAARLADIYSDSNNKSSLGRSNTGKSNTGNQHTESEAVDRPTLAHIVSCPRCLEQINDILRFPPLSDRFPTDMLGNDSGSKGNSGSRDALAKARIQSCSRLAKSVYNHEPSKLILAVNGFFAGAEVVTSVMCEQTLPLTINENLSLVEVFSEQGVRLAALHVAPPPEGDIEQTSSVALSEGRSIELAVDFRDARPILTTRYSYPGRARCPGAVQAEAHDLNDIAGAFAPESITVETVRGDIAKAEPAVTMYRRGLSLIERFLRGLAAGINPGAVTAVLSLLLAAALTIFQILPPRVSAAELLQKAARDERVLLPAGMVVHRRLSLEARPVSGSLPASTRVLDIWSNSQKGQAACRLYDDKGQLVAGEWTDSSGSQLICKRGEPSIRENPSDVTIDSLIASGSIWRIGLSAGDFINLIKHGPAAKLTNANGRYFIVCDLDGAAGGLLKATLVLNKATLHAIEQTLVVRSQTGTMEYRFVEQSAVTVPKGDAGPSSFSPDPELLGKPSIPAPRGPIGASRETEVPEPEASRLSDSDYVNLKLQAIYQLHKMDACMKDQIHLSRTPDGKLSIQLFSDTSSRKTELASGLATLAATGNAKVEVSTFKEAARQLPSVPMDNVVVRRIEVTGGRIPAYDDLRANFEREKGTAQPPPPSGASGEGSSSGAFVGTDQKIEAFAIRELKHSRLALLNAWALKQHQAEGMLGGDDLSSKPDVRTTAMMKDHLKAILRETHALDAELRPIFGPSAGSSPGQRVGDAESAGSGVDGLYRLILEN